jgi:multiple sugar transport system permease protein
MLWMVSKLINIERMEYRMTNVALKTAAKKAFVVMSVFLVMLFTLFPIWYCISTATKTAADAFSIPPKWVWNPIGDNFIEVLNTMGFKKSYLNSLIISVETTFLSLFFGIPCAYALARSRSRASKFVSVWILLSRMLPAMAFAVPFYFVYKKVGLNDTYIGLTLIYLTSQLPFTVWLLNGFIRTVPEEIEEAAMIDGCNRFQILVRVLVPTIQPGISTAAIFAFMSSWNEFFYAKLVSGNNTRPVSYAVYKFNNDVGTNWGLLCAASCMVALPMIAFCLFAQKSFVRGLTAGSVKG